MSRWFWDLVRCYGVGATIVAIIIIIIIIFIIIIILAKRKELLVEVMLEV